ncbi:uncharacterized protein BXZ73DRAFT_102360 [Epithele typhae]|uniref:uncharacterized protein n=1 Tax=Epithele typhae TaxID=378194 RepID=UPI002008204A|nr:uncharacterized protein BXZ73DRAFT_102360 [Epithele typhae]KAH9928521.1 hypothetical protein BXZ73DRAFT_102360 [Epithele typhae]
MPKAANPPLGLVVLLRQHEELENLRSLTLVHYLAPVTEPLDDSMCISLPNLTTLTIADEPGRIAHFLYHLDHSACTAIDLSASATPGTSKTVILHTRATHIIIGFTPRPPFVDATELECGQDTSTVVFPGITAFEYNESALAPTSHPEKILALRPTPAPLLDDLALAQRLFWETVDAATALLTPAHTTSAVRELRVEGPLDALDAHTLSLLLRSLPALHKLQLVHHAPRPAAGTVPARMPPGIASVFDAAAGSCAALRELELRDLPSAGCVPFLTALGAALEAGEHVEEAEGEEDEEEVVAELRDLFAGTAARVALWYGKRGRVVHEDDTDSAVDAMDWESDNLGGNPAVS